MFEERLLTHKQVYDCSPLRIEAKKKQRQMTKLINEREYKLFKLKKKEKEK